MATERGLSFGKRGHVAQYGRRGKSVHGFETEPPEMSVQWSTGYVDLVCWLVLRWNIGHVYAVFGFVMQWKLGSCCHVVLFSRQVFVSLLSAWR